jgi:hypothetical protein
MSGNIFYAAYSYLDQWMWKDRLFHEALAFEKTDVDANRGAETLVEVAKYYGVIRTLKVNAGESVRLESAYKMLTSTTSLGLDDVPTMVEGFAAELGNVYEGLPFSAASKFLWMRFRTPIVIYDSLVAAYVAAENRGYDNKTYQSFCSVWRKNYRQNQDAIQEACDELVSIKKFTLASECTDENVLKWTNSEWFRERVFDSFMQTNSPLIGNQKSSS